MKGLGIGRGGVCSKGPVGNFLDCSPLHFGGSSCVEHCSPPGPGHSQKKSKKASKEKGVHDTGLLRAGLSAFRVESR